MTTWFKQALQDKDIQELLSSAIGVGHTVRNNTNRITELKHELSTLRIDLEEQRQYSRRNAIRIYNTDWQNESREENTDLMVLNLLRDNLGLTSLTAADISRSHRVGRPGQGNGPRPILVKFIGYRTKEAVMKKKKDLPNHVQIYDDLSKYMSALAYEARQLKRSHLICDTWVYDGRVYVKPTARDKPVVVLSPEYLADVIPPEGTLVSFADATHGRPAPRRFTRDDATGQGTRSSTLSMRSSTGSHRVHTRPINGRQSAPIVPNLPPVPSATVTSPVPTTMAVAQPSAQVGSTDMPFTGAPIPESVHGDSAQLPAHQASRDDTGNRAGGTATQTRTDDVPSSPTHSVEMSSPSVSTDTQPPTSAQDNEAGDADETYDSLETFNELSMIHDKAMQFHTTMSDLQLTPGNTLFTPRPRNRRGQSATNIKDLVNLFESPPGDNSSDGNKTD